MNLFETVKYGVSNREAAVCYGVEVNRSGMALCPFHNDRHPSLLVADDHYHCFACGEHGDVIDFVAKLFELSLYDAARKLAADFHLSPDKPPNAAALNNRRKDTQAQQLRKKEQLCFSDLTDYLWILRDWKVRYAPRSPNEEQLDARFIEACHEIDHVEYLLDELMAGDSQERAELLDSNSVQKIQSHLAQIKEEHANV
ncbi:MAG: CHC2 zinc finger domain-containing protein [Clostridiales bacterium]|nr:CHC2 zinc finger domain-containing protein [Clostridiales bacterium]